MNYQLFDIKNSYNRPKFWLARPNKRIVTRMKELDDIVSLRLVLGQLSEVSGELPTVLIRNDKTVKNPHIKYFKNKYLLKMEFMDKVEWFVIENVGSNASSESDSIPFTAYNMAYNLTGNKLYNDKYEGKTLKEVVDDMLMYTSWSIGKVSTKIGGKIRTFDEFSANTSVIEAIEEICTSYGCIPEYDSDKKLINFLHEDDYQTFHNLMLNDKNYIESMSRSIDSSEIVTRLYPTGEEGLSINSVTPTGKSYIDRLDWFMYPFKRDNAKKTITSSDYMSDELCHAILDQQEKINEIAPIVKAKNDAISELYDGLIPLNDEIDKAKLKYEICEGILDVMRANNEYDFSDFSNGNTHTINFRKGYYVLQIRASNGVGSVSLNGTTQYLTSDWKTFKYDKSTLDPLGDGESMNITKLSGTVDFICVRVPDTEYNQFTDIEIRDKYNVIYLKSLLDIAQKDYDDKLNQIKVLEGELKLLYDSVGDDKFFTFELLEEKSEFIKEYYWNESTYTDVQELYDASIEEMKKLHKPSVEISTSVYNFLDSLEDKRNWKKLIIGSKVLIKHTRLDVYNEVVLTEINFNFGSKDIQLTLKDVKDLTRDQYIEMIMQGANASHQLNLNKHKYDDAVIKSQTFDEILNSEWDAVKNGILAGINESVKINNRGISITSSDNPKDMLIGNSGVLAISNDGGQTFKNAITTRGIVAERIIGKLIIGKNVIVRDDDGTMNLTGSKQTIQDRSGVKQVVLGEYSPNKFGFQGYGKKNTITIDGNKGFEITRNSDNKRLLYLDDSGGAVFDGTITMTGGNIEWSKVNTPTASQVGARPSNWIPSETDVVGSKLTKITSNGVYTGTIEANQIYAGTITGFTINGSVINSVSGSLSTQIAGAKVQFYKNGVDYGSLNPEGLIFKSRYTNPSGIQYDYNSKLDGGILDLQATGVSNGLSFRTKYAAGTIDFMGEGSIDGTSISFYNSKTNFTSHVDFNSSASIYGSFRTYSTTTLASTTASSLTVNGRVDTNTLYENGDRVATQWWSNNKFWATGQSGYISSNVYIGGASIGVGGMFDGSSSASNVSLGASNIYVPNKVYASGVALTSSRDKKKNIVTYDDEVLPLVKDMRPVTYHLKEDNDNEVKRLGFILEELGLVHLIDPDGGVDQYALITLAIKAIQELNRKVENMVK